MRLHCKFTRPLHRNPLLFTRNAENHVDAPPKQRHYRPVDYPNLEDEIHYAIPPHWAETFPPQEELDELVMVGTSFKEPNCKNLLCSVDESNEISRHLVNWHGPAPKGMIVTTGWDPVTMTPPTHVQEGYDGGKRDGTAAKEILEKGNVVRDEL